MARIRHVRTLVYYDGPQVFEARDTIGGHYIAVMGAFDEIRYLVAGVAPEHLQAFFDQETDLRTLVARSDVGSRYTTSRMPGEAGDDDLPVEPFRAPLETSGFLPPAGFTLDPDDLLASDLAAYANERDSLAFSMSLEASAHRIASDLYADAIHGFQALTGSALRAMRGDDESWRWKDGLFDVVVPAAAGSLRVMLEASSRQGPEFSAKMAGALRRVDKLFQADRSEVLRVATQNRGRVAGAYIKLLKLLAKNGTGLRYAWKGRGAQEIRSGAVSVEEAKYLANALAETRASGGTFTQDGTLYRYNTQSGYWGLETKLGRLVGWVRGGGPDLSGLRMGWRYRFNCDVEYHLAQEDDDVAKGTVYLLSHEQLGPGQ